MGPKSTKKQKTSQNHDIDIDILNAKIRELEEQLKKSKDDYDYLSLNHSEQMVELESVREQLLKTNQPVIQYNDEKCIQLKKQNEELQATINKLKKENEEFKEKVSLVVANIHEINNQMDVLKFKSEKEVKTLHEEKKNLQDQLKEATERKDTVMKEYEALFTEHTETREELKKLNEKIIREKTGCIYDASEPINYTLQQFYDRMSDAQDHKLSIDQWKQVYKMFKTIIREGMFKDAYGILEAKYMHLKTVTDHSIADLSQQLKNQEQYIIKLLKENTDIRTAAVENQYIVLNERLKMKGLKYDHDVVKDPVQPLIVKNEVLDLT